MSGVRLPLTVWGTGTRRLASLTVAELLQDGHPITLVDEMERGLEPYRQRSLAKSLMKAGGQSLVTTHSSAAIGALTNASLWYMDSQQRLGELSGTAIAAHGSRDPEAFLARLLIVCEGATEVGFATHMLEKVLRADLLDHGVRLTDAGGNDTALELLTVLGKARLRIAGIVDNEMRSPGRWQRVGQRLGDLLLQWPSGCLEEQVIPLFPVERWQELVQDPNGDLTGIRLRHLGDRLQISDSDVSSVADAAKGRVLYLIVDAATGRLPPDLPQGRRAEFKSHARSWFKSVEGGRELAHKVFELGAWESLEPLVRSFIAALARNLNIRLA